MIFLSVLCRWGNRGPQRDRDMSHCTFIWDFSHPRYKQNTKLSLSLMPLLLSELP